MFEVLLVVKWKGGFLGGWWFFVVFCFLNLSQGSVCSPVMRFVHLDVVVMILATQVFSGSASRD